MPTLLGRPLVPLELMMTEQSTSELIRCRVCHCTGHRPCKAGWRTRFVPPMFTRGESPGAMVVRLQVAESVGDLARGEGGDGACCPER